MHRLLCFFGIHRRVLVETSDFFVSHEYDCRDCRKTWHWVSLGEGSGWVMASD